MILLSCNTEEPAELIFRIKELPPDTPGEDAIYLAGNFNDWNPADPDYILSKNPDGLMEIGFDPEPGTLKYKFTRGSWESVEANSKGEDIEDRSLTYSGGGGLLEVRVTAWKDLVEHPTTAAENVSIMDREFQMPQLGRTRRIWVYLPPDYHESGASYPVLYMHDGQNLFDDYTSFVGEWGVDEELNSLFSAGDSGVIVVGTDHGNSRRLDEYSPWLNEEYGGGEGEYYAAFLVETLKPYIDANYRTLPDREHTGVMGSSMGGLISHYIALEYQDVFSKAGIFSPSYWFSDSLYAHTLDTGKEQDMRFYIIGSRNEGAGYDLVLKDMGVVLKEAGFGEGEIKLLVHSDGAHSEWYWRREFPAAYQWLYQ